MVLLSLKYCRIINWFRITIILGNFDIFPLITQSDIVCINKLTLILKMISQCSINLIKTRTVSDLTSAGSVLQLCKVSQKSNKPFRRSCAYKVHVPLFS